MALTSVSKVFKRNSQKNNKDLAAALTTAVTELQRLKQVIVTGAGANTNIAVSGIATADKIVSVLNLTDLTTPAGVTISSAGNIRSTDDLTNKKLLVTYFDVA